MYEEDETLTDNDAIVSLLSIPRKGRFDDLKDSAAVGWESSSPAAALVSRAAEAILRAALARCGGVSVAVRAPVDGLVTGAVQGVRLRGERWESPGGLSARSLKVSVGAGRVDVGALLSRGAIELAVPKPLGVAEIAFTVADFGSLLRHPLLEAAADGIADLSPKGARAANDGVAFGARASGAGANVKYQGYVLSRAQRGECVVTPVDPTRGDADLATALTGMFAGLTLDLSGSQFSFAELVACDDESGVVLRLDVTVARFPPPRVDF